MMEILDCGVDDDFQPPQSLHGHDWTLGHRDHARLGLGHPGRYEAARTVGQSNEIVNLPIAPYKPQYLKAFSLQSMETIINFDNG
jgi:hypothetical protein